MGYVGIKDMRSFVRSCQEDPTVLRKIRTFYKGVLVTVPGKTREAKIDDVIPKAGSFQFAKGDGAGMSTVAVRRAQRYYSCRRLTGFFFFLTGAFPASSQQSPTIP